MKYELAAIKRIILRAIEKLAGFLVALLTSTFVVTLGLLLSRTVQDSRFLNIFFSMPLSLLVLDFVGAMIGLIALFPVIIAFTLTVALLARMFRWRVSDWKLISLWCVGSLICAVASELVMSSLPPSNCPDNPGGLVCLIVRDIRRTNSIVMMIAFILAGLVGGVVFNFLTGRAAAQHSIAVKR